MRLVYGVGINDAPYTVKGEGFHCPFHRKWSDMMTRAYSDAYHLRRPTYKDVEVCEEWQSFIGFKSWMEDQDWEGKELDKDLRVVGNKIYSPETCMFVSSRVNSILESCRATRGEYPIGVDKLRDVYRSRVTGAGYLGVFETEKEAHAAWQLAKIKVIEGQYRLCSPEEKEVLSQVVERILDDWSAGKETIL